MQLISIDGACRRNGKPDCTAAGGIFVQVFDTLGQPLTTEVRSVHEYKSTNQRGELLALLVALDIVCTNKADDNLIVTDSEYLFNAMTKHWYTRWHANNWLSASGEPVKNRDIWLEITALMQRCDALHIEPTFYHIKGHCIPFGRVTADNLLAKDPTGKLLHAEVRKKLQLCAPTKREVFSAAQELSKRNNGYELPENVFNDFVVANVVADAIATKTVDAADNSRKR